ncbi:MAG: Zn-ribbon domain-containing OB-fold protein [bacterium]|nr:Zn-ribbon domain-containing OB-fold protein [Gammaproteobacteria bacterium]HIL98930.1 Zn-ribbon domain-containing OB-fold protein [Pseudomonadales bacterium]
MADKSKVSLPMPTPETEHFWKGAKQAELKLQKCGDCSHVYFPPRPFCPSCASRSVEVFTASGRGTLYSYVINHRPHPAHDNPYSIAVVSLDEGPRMMTNIINCPQTPEALQLDMSVEVIFEEMSEEISLPYFQPSATGA